MIQKLFIYFVVAVVVLVCVYRLMEFNKNLQVDSVQAMSVQSATVAPRENQRMTVQVNDWLAVGAVCADGSPATVDSIYSDAVVFVCGE